MKYLLTRNVANYKKGEVLEFDKLPLGLQAHAVEVKEEEKPKPKPRATKKKAEPKEE